MPRKLRVPQLPEPEQRQALGQFLTVLDQHPALGVWRGAEPVNEPSAGELFATSFSALTADAASSYPSSATINSPGSQDFGPGGELIGSSSSLETPAADSLLVSQPVDGVLVAASDPDEVDVSKMPEGCGIIRQRTEKGGEQFAAGLVDPSLIPSRVVRRGRPVALNDLAKGRLLRPMSVGLSLPPGRRPAWRSPSEAAQQAEAGRGVGPASFRGPARRHLATTAHRRPRQPHQLAGRLAGQVAGGETRPQFGKHSRRARAGAEAELGHVES